MTKPLSSRRKADRETMANAVIALATRLGASAERDEVFADDPLRIFVRIQAPGGLCLTVEFDGENSYPDTHVLSWHMSTTSDNRLNPDYWPCLNTVHFHKATDVAEGFDALCQVLETRLTALADGRAYQSSQPYVQGSH